MRAPYGSLKRNDMERQAFKMRQHNLTHGTGCKSTARAIAQRTGATSITPGEAAQLLGIRSSSVYTLISRGTLPARQGVNGRKALYWRDVDCYMQKRSARGL